MQSNNNFSSAPPSGMRDLLPGEVALRDWASLVILKTYEKFGFTHIETPALENISLLRRGEGGENLQLIFEVLKRGEKLDKLLDSNVIDRHELVDLGLRFDLTVPLVRFYANNQANLPNPFKAIQLGSVWRAESPQQGRYRQFTQCDIDTIGIKSEIAEVELLQASSEALLALGFKDFIIRINDRRILSGIAETCGFAQDKFDNVFIAVDKLDKVGIEGVRKELQENSHPTNAIDRLVHILSSSDNLSKPSALQEMVKSVSASVYERLQMVIEAIREQSADRYSIKFDSSLVRGMGYYTGQIFEFGCPGYSHSIGGGGRYDNMIGKFLGREIPACGFSFGFERVISIISEQKFMPPNTVKKIALIAEPDRDKFTDILQASQKLLEQGFVTSIHPRKKDMRKQLDTLLSQGYSNYCVFKGSVDNLDIKNFTG